MNAEFDLCIKELPKLMAQLRKEPLLPPNDLPTIPSQGIYVFYEDSRPIYVGRSNNMRRRIKEHCAASSTHHSATFAFKLAKKQEKGTAKRTDKALAQDTAFANTFAQKRQKVSNMLVRVIAIEDQITQYLFEAYAVLELGTTEYNDFWTH